MQLMPDTWTAMRARLGLGGDPDDPRDNIVAGTAYLRLLYDRFGYPGLFAAYNAGPGRWAAYLQNGRPLPGETIGYLGRVANVRSAPGSSRIAAKPTGIFVEIGAEKSAVAVGKDHRSMLFVPLNSASQSH